MHIGQEPCRLHHLRSLKPLFLDARNRIQIDTLRVLGPGGCQGSCKEHRRHDGDTEAGASEGRHGQSVYVAKPFVTRT